MKNDHRFLVRDSVRCQRDISEGLVSKSFPESPKGLGQYVTPRELIQVGFDFVRPGQELLGL